MLRIFIDPWGDSTMSTFVVSDVPVGKSTLQPWLAQDAVSMRLDRPVAGAASNLPVAFTMPGHPFVSAAAEAFRSHLPLVLSPDDVWLCIAQAAGRHIGAHAESLRDRLVDHRGKLTIEVRRDDFVLDSPDNDWPGVFAEFADRVKDHSGAIHRLFRVDFSTTGLVERAAQDVALLAAAKSFFDWKLSTLCGIPSITLLGDSKDWSLLQAKADELETIGLRPWLNALRPALDAFAAASRGDADPNLWRSFFKWDGQSGGSAVTGWINVLFPTLEYPELRSGEVTIPTRPNRLAHVWRRGADDGKDPPKETNFGTGLASAPLIWQCLSQTFEMEMIAGFVGVSQDPETRAVRPAIGWAVASKDDALARTT